MAQYTVEHTCGHTHTYQLYGKISERERKMEWLAGQDCPDCRRKAEIAKLEADNSPVTAKAIPTIGEGEHPEWITLEIEFQGGTYNRREELRSMGAEYGEAPANAGLFGLLSTKERKVWHKPCHLTADAARSLLESPSLAALTEAIRKAAGLPEDMPIELPAPNDPDAALLVERMRKAIETTDKLAALPPEPPLWSICERLGKPASKWNGKFYGREGLTVYLDGEETQVPAKLKAEWQATCKAHDEWKAKRAAALEKHE